MREVKFDKEKTKKKEVAINNKRKQSIIETKTDEKR